MRLAAVVCLAIGLGACTRSDQQRAREDAERTKEQARRTGEQLKRDAREAFQNAKTEAQKAGREIDTSLDETRNKVRQKLNEGNKPADSDTDHR